VRALPRYAGALGVDALICMANAGHTREGLAVGSLNRTLRVEEGLWDACKDDQSEDGRRTRLMSASADGDVARVRFLLARGAALELKNVDGDTALNLAAYWGHLDVVRELLSPAGRAVGADVNTQSTEGDTVLYGASQEGHALVVRELLARGALVDAASSEATHL
jgi:ankyrin repeat protein